MKGPDLGKTTEVLSPSTSCTTLLNIVEPSQYGESFVIRSRLIPLCSVSKVCGVPSNGIFLFSCDVQPRTVTVPYPAWVPLRAPLPRP